MALNKLASPSNSLVQNLRQQLMRVLPFSKMAIADVDYFLRHSIEAYFAPGETILSPADGVPKDLFLIRQGRVSGRRLIPGFEEMGFELAAGELFSVSACYAGRSVTSKYVAIEDSFCLALPVNQMHELAKQSKPFGDFLNNRILKLLEESRTALRNSFASQALTEQSLESPLGDLALKKPISVLPSTPLQDALQLIHQKKVGSVLVVDEAGTIQGILTRYDILGRVTLAQIPLDTPIAKIMSTMSLHHIRHLPVLRGKEIVGIISERDLFSLQRLSLNNISSAIRGADDVASLKECANNIRKFARNLLGQGVQARQLTGLISHLNDVLTAQLITLFIKKHDLDLERFAWISLGSEGRSEQTIATDQDNALILMDSEVVNKERYLAFANEVNQALDQCGYPLCKGNIMASNPELCIGQQEWLYRFERWIEQGNPEDLLKASIFFDFRALAGNASLLKPLRDYVVKQAQATPRFIKLLTENSLHWKVPFNWFGSLETKELDGKKIIDIKMQGTAIVVDAARIYSLAHGIAAVNTRERLAAVGRALNVSEAESMGWIASFEYLQTLRLAAQIDGHAIGGNKVRNLQQQLELDYVR
ncbi:MAG: CBS domain-containing protein [Burkholderiaceae bacterium]|nr:CBS domain-containing protein [Burkholderiaceae bacterium]